MFIDFVFIYFNLIYLFGHYQTVTGSSDNQSLNVINNNNNNKVTNQNNFNNNNNNNAIFNDLFSFLQYEQQQQQRQQKPPATTPPLTRQEKLPFSNPLQEHQPEQQVHQTAALQATTTTQQLVNNAAANQAQQHPLYTENVAKPSMQLRPVPQQTQIQPVQTSKNQPERPIKVVNAAIENNNNLRQTVFWQQTGAPQIVTAQQLSNNAANQQQQHAYTTNAAQQTLQPTEGPKQQTIQQSFKPSSYTVYKLMGQEIPLQSKDGIFNRISNAPRPVQQQQQPEKMVQTLQLKYTTQPNATFVASALQSLQQKQQYPLRNSFSYQMAPSNIVQINSFKATATPTPQQQPPSRNQEQSNKKGVIQSLLPMFEEPQESLPAKEGCEVCCNKMENPCKTCCDTTPLLSASLLKIATG